MAVHRRGQSRKSQMTARPRQPATKINALVSDVDGSLVADHKRLTPEAGDDWPVRDLGAPMSNANNARSIFGLFVSGLSNPPSKLPPRWSR